MVGVHGAGLTLALLLPPCAALLEVWHQGGQWRVFENIAQLRGIIYDRVRVPQASASVPAERARADVTRAPPPPRQSSYVRLADGWGVQLDAKVTAVHCLYSCARPQRCRRAADTVPRR